MSFSGSSPEPPDRSNACNFYILHFLIFYTFLRVNFACKNYTFACKFWGVNYTRWGVNYTPWRVNYTPIFCELHSVSVHFQLDFPHVCGAFEPKQHPPLSQNTKKKQHSTHAQHMQRNQPHGPPFQAASTRVAPPVSRRPAPPGFWLPLWSMPSRRFSPFALLSSAQCAGWPEACGY